MSKKLLYLCLSAAILLPTQAQAISKKISSPHVHEGHVTVENYGYVEFDDEDKWKNTTELEYGVTERLKLAIAGEIEKEEGESLEYEASEIEAMYLLTGEEAYMESALELAYEMNHLGDADKVEAKLLLKKDYGKWAHKANLALEHEVGSDRESGLGAGLAFGSYYKMDGYKLGGEYYADFGRLKDDLDFDDQEHHIGPVVGFHIPVAGHHVKSKLGYLVGISEAAADNIVKYEFEIEF